MRRRAAQTAARGIDRARVWAAHHPVASTTATRVVAGVVTIWLVSLLVFAATQVLPGNAAYAVLGPNRDPGALKQIERELRLDRPVVEQYTSWVGGVLHGDFGNSLAGGGAVTDNVPVSDLVGPRFVNTGFLVVTGGLLGCLLGITLGLLAALRRDTRTDHALSNSALALTALPEFLIAIGLITLLGSSLVISALPAVAIVIPGEPVWTHANSLILPVLTLSLMTAPYIMRMTRGALIDALESEYAEMAVLKGLSRRRVLLTHALPNAFAPILQVVGLTLLYLAGGVVAVEYVFNYPGVGSALVSAVSSRDIPTIQLLVLGLAAFYIVVNIATDVLTLLVTPRRRLGH